MSENRETFNIDPQMVNDDFIRKNFNPQEGFVQTEDLVGELSPNKENRKHKKASSAKKKKKPTREEIANANQKIGSFFQAKNGRRKTPKKKNVIDLNENNGNMNKIVEEVCEKKEENEKIEEEGKVTNGGNESIKVETPKLGILSSSTVVPKTKKSKFTKSFVLPDKSEFPWKEKLFVISGKLKITENRKEMNEFLNYWGMVSRSSVSKKTDILIHGHILDDGREYHQSGKYKKAKKFKTIDIYSEEQVDKLFQEFTGFSLEENFNKWNENVEAYPRNLIEEMNEAVEPVELDDDEVERLIGKQFNKK
jgi:NAD-dependent DNA ligase